MAYSYSVLEWAKKLDLKKSGTNAYCGPCPDCGGDDRFHVHESNAKTLLGCRGCIDGRPRDEGKAAYFKICKIVWGDEEIGYKVANKNQVELKQQKNEAIQTEREGRSAIAYSRRIWSASEIADKTPAHRYLYRRKVWMEPTPDYPVPANVRYINKGKMFHGDSYKADNYPKALAGFVLFRFRDKSGNMTAVSLEGVTDAGVRLDKVGLKRFRRTYGVKNGARFVCRFSGKSYPSRLMITEGEITALAVSALFPGIEVWAMGGASSLQSAILPTNRSITIDADGDERAIEAANILIEKNPKASIAIFNRDSGRDATDDLSDIVLAFSGDWSAILRQRRAASMRFDGQSFNQQDV